MSESKLHLSIAANVQIWNWKSVLSTVWTVQCIGIGSARMGAFVEVLPALLEKEKLENLKMETVEKFVWFNEYCHKCIHKNIAEDKDPCNECLAYPTNENSHKPVKYKER